MEFNPSVHASERSRTPDRERSRPDEDMYTCHFRYTTLPLIRAMFDGSMATCFAYGQTGSGKTYTMGGQGDLKGLYSLAAGDIFKMARRAGSLMEVRLSFFEIYGTKVVIRLNPEEKYWFWLIDVSQCTPSNTGVVHEIHPKPYEHPQLGEEP